MMDIRAVAFDLEGTLIDVELAHHSGHLEIACALGLNLTLEEARTLIPDFVGGGDEVIAAALHRMSGTLRTEEEILTQLKRAYQAHLRHTNIVPRPGVRDFISGLYRTGTRFGIGSLTPRDEAALLLHVAGLEGLFKHAPVICREDVTCTKPNPEVFVRTAEALNVKPEEQLVFEDSPTGVKAAVRAGSRVVAVPTIRDKPFVAQLLECGAAAVFLDWREVTMPKISAFI